MIDQSGIGSSLWGSLQNLTSRRPDWHFILIGSPQSPRLQSLSSHRSEIHDFAAPIYSLAEQWQWIRRWSRKDFDLLWIPHYNVPVAWRGPMLVTVHDLAHLALPKIFGPLKRIYARLLMGHVGFHANAIAFVSKFTEDEFHRYIGKPRGASMVVHNSVASEWQLFAKKETKGEATPYILAVGNVKPHKNLGRLVEAFGRIASNVPHKLILVGKRDGFITGDTTISNAIARFPNRIECTGYIPDEGLIRLVANADLLVQPSLYEGFGIPPLEAMTVGCPVAVSDRASLPEICADAAAYFDPEDVSDISAKLERLLLDSNERQLLIEKGYRRASEFSWDHAGEKLESLMTQMLESRAR